MSPMRARRLGRWEVVGLGLGLLSGERGRKEEEGGTIEIGILG